MQDPTSQNSLDHSMESSFRLTGRHVDEEVLKGRALKDVLAEMHKHPGQEIWSDPKMLRHYSAAVAVAYDPLYLPG